MKKTFDCIPQFDHVIYEFDAASTCYRVVDTDKEKGAVKRLTGELIISSIKAKRIRNNARTAIHSKRCLGSRYDFITGVIEIGSGGWQAGNWFERHANGKVVLPIVFFIEGNTLNVFFFLGAVRKRSEVGIWQELQKFDYAEFGRQAIPLLRGYVPKTA